MSRPDLGIALPPTWQRRSEPGRGVLVRARPATAPASGVRPEITLRCTSVSADLVTWRAAALAELGRRLENFEVEDADDYERGAGRSPTDASPTG
ncbi:MAG: hypothetical protein JWO11_4180 [Nocardioides sp.]|nr:hypothetical protein [Nocardioides sp.]